MVIIPKDDFGYERKLLSFDEVFFTENEKLNYRGQFMHWGDRHDGLMEHIRKCGLINAIPVIKKDEQYFFTGIGQARVQCLLKLGCTHTEFIVLQDESEIRPLLIKQLRTGPENYCTEPDNKWWENEEI